MSNVPIRHRMRRTVNLDPFTDELHTDVGAAAFCLAELFEGTGHDYFSGEDLGIYTAIGMGGTHLIENTHYVLSEPNTVYSTLATNAAGSTKTIYKKIQITDVTYQTGALYFNGKYFTDYADPEDLNNLTKLVQAKSTDYALTDFAGNEHFEVTTAAAAIVFTMCDPAINKDTEKTFVKIDSGAGALALLPHAAETFSGAALLLLQKQWDHVTVKSNGTNWVLIEGKKKLWSGLINSNDATDRHFGFVTINYTGKAGTIGLGRYVTEATSGNKAIVIYDSGTALTVVGVIEDGTGFTNGRTITSDSGGTATVNGNTRNVDSNIRHGWGCYLHQLNIKCNMSTDKTEENTYAIFPTFVYLSAADVRGLFSRAIDNNSFKLQTGAISVVYLTDSGLMNNWTTNSYYYEIYIEQI